MNNGPVTQHSQAWVSFTYACFVGALAMLAGGILFLPLDVWIKAYLAMGVAMLVQSCLTLAKTIRDQHEGGKLLSRLEEAKTERLLMEAGKG